MKTIYISDPCLEPFRIHQYSQHFEIFIYEDVKKNRKYFYDFSRLPDCLEFKKKHKVEVDRIAFNDGSRAFHFLHIRLFNCIRKKLSQFLPRCEISADRSKLEVKIKEIDLFDV